METAENVYISSRPRHGRKEAGILKSVTMNCPNCEYGHYMKVTPDTMRELSELIVKITLRLVYFRLHCRRCDNDYMFPLRLKTYNIWSDLKEWKT
jgi:hypothetical protein